MIRPSPELILTQKREALGWSKTDLARRAGMQPSRVGQIENGRAVPPRDSVELMRLAVQLGFTGPPADLLKPVEEPAEAARA